MATKSIDLDALAAELTAAGFSASTYYDDELARTDLAIHITRNGAQLQALTVHASGNMSGLIPNHNDKLWEAISIYRKHVSPVADPAPPAVLLAAAREYISAHDSQMETYERRDNSGPGLTAVIEASQRLETALDALRREVEAAAEPVPVALTKDERKQLIIVGIEARRRHEAMEDSVDAVLAKLDELGFELRRRA